MTRQMSCKSFVAGADDATGTIDKIVSVFGNVDYAGDRVNQGAFTASLERWAHSDGPIPVIFSHQWNVLEAHVGVVEDAKELAPGDPLLVETAPQLAEYGGLWVRERYDMDQPFAARLHELQKQRRIKESSFAYDVIKEKKGPAGVNDLLELDIIEVGPTLKGMNPETVVIDAKTRAAAEAAAGKTHTDDQTHNAVPPPENDAEPGSDHDSGAADDSHAADAPEAPEPTDTTEQTAENTDTGEPGDADSKSTTGQPAAPGRKAQVTLDGSYEQLQERLSAAVRDWANETYDPYDLWTAYLEATYADHVIVYVELWSQPLGGGDYLQVTYAADESGAVTLDAPTPVELTGVVAPKQLPQELRDRKAAALAVAKANAGQAGDNDSASAHSVLAAVDVGLLEV